VVTLTSDASGQVHLSVRDFGPGVDEEQLAHLTEPFYRADSARQRATGGVGLGLYLCQLVAQAHGGALSIRRAEPGLEVSASWPIDPATP
jgi:signal transduction histidine kinase